MEHDAAGMQRTTALKYEVISTFQNALKSEIYCTQSHVRSLDPIERGAIGVWVEKGFECGYEMIVVLYIVQTVSYASCGFHGR